MSRKNTEYYLMQGIVVISIALICLISYAITDALKNGSVEQEDINYVSYEVLTDNVMPVSKQDDEKKDTPSKIVRPYTEQSVKIGKNYYDYKGEETTQQNSIVYYENTYMQNTGVDYTSNNTFSINSIADGKVISVTQDDIVGTTIKIEHSDNIVSVYQSVKDTKVKEKDEVAKGQVIATSGTNNIGSELGNHLHFEVYKDNILVNPETFFTANTGS